MNILQNAKKGYKEKTMIKTEPKRRLIKTKDKRQTQKQTKINALFGSYQIKIRRLYFVIFNRLIT